MEYHAPSVAIAAKVLKLLSRHKYRNCSLTLISEKLEVNKTTCLRVLKTLERDDMVRYNESTKRYSLGPYLIVLGNRAGEFLDSVAAATEKIHYLAEKIRHTTVLIQRWDDRLIYIASAEPPAEEVRISVSVGQQLPLTAGAFGRCFLAYDPPTARHRILADEVENGSEYSEYTVPNSEQAERLLKDVRAKGYAMSHGELLPGFSAIAVPIFEGQHRVGLVMATIVVTAQLNPQLTEMVVGELMSAAAKLSEWSGVEAIRDSSH